MNQFKVEGLTYSEFLNQTLVLALDKAENKKKKKDKVTGKRVILTNSMQPIDIEIQCSWGIRGRKRSGIVFDIDRNRNSINDIQVDLHLI